MTTSANTVIRIRGVAKKTRSNQLGSREASSPTYAKSGNVRRHQDGALLVADTMTMDRDVAKWKEMDPPVRDPFIISSSPQVFD